MFYYAEDRTWHFEHNWNGIWAKIEDEGFWRKVHEGLHLPEGSALKVELVSRTVEGEIAGAEHRITRVYQTINGSVVHQSRLLPDDAK